MDEMFDRHDKELKELQTLTINTLKTAKKSEKQQLETKFVQMQFDLKAKHRDEINEFEEQNGIYLVIFVN